MGLKIDCVRLGVVPVYPGMHTVIPPKVARSPTNLRNDRHWARTLDVTSLLLQVFIILALSIYSVPSSHFVCKIRVQKLYFHAPAPSICCTPR